MMAIDLYYLKIAFHSDKSFQMEYSISEKITITAWTISFENESIESRRRKFAERFNKPAPTRTTFLHWREKLLEIGTLVADRPRTGRPVSASGDDVTADVLADVHENPSTSTRKLSNDHDVSQTTVCRILKNAGMHPYKPQYSQFITDADDDRRKEFCETMIQKFTNDPAYLRKLTFSDECVFALNGNVNKHNVHYWSEENPHHRICNPGKTASLTVWTCISFAGVVAFDVSKETMNGERYCKILREKVLPFFTRKRQMMYQQDGAAPHYSISARQILDQQMPQQWIGRRGHIEWPARSPDLTVCDYWLWSYLRSRVYSPAGIIFESLDELKHKITSELQAVPTDMFRRAFRDFPKRCQLCIDNEGGLFEM